MRKRQGRHRRLAVVAIAMGLIAAALPASGALAVAASADVTVAVIAPSPYQQPTGDVDYVAEVTDNGPDAANSVNVSFVAAGGTIASVTDISTHVPTRFNCVLDNATHAHCTIGSLTLARSFRDLDVVVNSATGNHDQSVTGTVTASTNDPDNSNNSSEGDAYIVVPPAASMAAFATEDKFYNSVTVNGTLTQTAGGTPIAGEPVTLWFKAPGAATFTKYDGGGSVYTNGSGVGSFDVFSTGPFGAGSFVFEVRHAKTAVADVAKDQVGFTPPATKVTISPPKATSYRTPTKIPGTLTFTSGGTTQNAGAVLLQARPKGSSGAWSTVTDSPVRNKHGALRFTAKLDRNSELRGVYVSNSPGSATSVSGVASLNVAAQVTVKASPRFVPPGAPSTVAVTVAPAAKGGRLALQRAVGSGWKTVAHGSLGRHSAKTWTLRSGHHPGTEGYRVVRAKSSTNLGATSKAAKVTVENHGPGRASDHAFLFFKGHNVRDVIRWNPCQAIHYRINSSEAPKNGLADAQEAIRRVAQASGLSFAYDGTTHAIPQGHGHQAAPLVIAWAKPNQTDLPVDKTEDGAGGGRVVLGSKPRVIQGWAVLLAHEKEVRPGFGRGHTVGALLLHEIGHAVGLDHSNGASQIMYPVSQAGRAAAIYGAGDYKGLQILGSRSHGCTTEIHAG